MHLLTIIAALGWDPEIRGALTVVLAVTVLMGSVWLILVTNTGIRLGTLLALAGFFGWMVLMGTLWWIYGIGYVGNSPKWVTEEVNVDPGPGFEDAGIQQAVIGNVSKLPDPNCFSGAENAFPPADADALRNFQVRTEPGCLPLAVDLMMAYDGEERQVALQELLNPQKPESKLDYIRDSDGITDSADQFMALMTAAANETEAALATTNDVIGQNPDDPRYLDEAGFQEELQSLYARRDLRVNDLSLGELEAVAPDIITWATDEGYLELNGWNLLSTAESGEAVAEAQADLADLDVYGSHEFVVLDTFQQGGKPKRTKNGLLDRVWFKIKNTAMITHPTNYAVVQTQIAVPKETLAGQLPPIPEPDPEGATVSVVMIRNLGNLRLRPALLTLASLLAFGATVLALHFRDLDLWRREGKPRT